MTILRSDTLPNGWALTDFSEVAAINPNIDKTTCIDNQEVSFVPMQAVEAATGRIDISQTRLLGQVKKGYTPFQEGDVLFAKITPCMENGKIAVVPELKGRLGFGSTEFHVLRPHQGISKNYLYYYVSSKSFRREAEHNMSGAVGQRRVTTPYLSACKLPLPPEREQHRIVAKIEELFSELDKGIDNLKTAQAQLKVYRRAILQHAFEGKLTTQWRTDNVDVLESAEALVLQIQQARTHRYQSQLVEWESDGKKGSKPKAPLPLRKIDAEQLAILPRLPEGWAWMQLEYLITGIDQGWSPKCGNTPAADDEWGVIKTTAVQHGQFFDTENKVLPPSLAPREQHELNTNDILVTRAGPRVRVGVCCLVRNVRKKIMNCDKVYRIRSMPTISKPNYLEGALNSPSILKAIERIKSGINDSGVNLNQGAFLNLAIPLCSLAEQTAVIKELDEKLSVITQLDQTLAESLQQSEALRESILKKAFSGQLAPQDPTDEPVTALLARIKEAKSAQSNGKKARK